MLTYEEAVEKWARDKFDDVPLAAKDFDFEVDHQEGYSYSEYTSEPDSTTMYLTYKVNGNVGRVYIDSTSGSGELSFGNIIREITAIAAGTN